MKTLPKINKTILIIQSLPFVLNSKKLRNRAQEFKSLKSFNEWVKNIFQQNDCDLYFPKLIKIENEFIIVPNPCQII